MFLEKMHGDAQEAAEEILWILYLSNAHTVETLLVYLLVTGGARVVECGDIHIVGWSLFR